MSPQVRFPGRWAAFRTFGKVGEGERAMTLYGPPRRPIFWKLDPRTIARDDTKVRFMDAKAEQIGDIGVRAAMIGAASFKVCAPDNDFADLARSSLRERAESYARAGRGGRGKSAKQRQG